MGENTFSIQKDTLVPLLMALLKWRGINFIAWNIREVYTNIHLDSTKDDVFLPIIDPPMGIGVFQTKRHWAETARLEIIQCSTETLTEYTLLHPDVYIRLAFPGIGNFLCDESQPPSQEAIKQALFHLPNNVTVVRWRLVLTNDK